MEHYILGLDSGATIGYALLDLDGNLVAIDSFKGTLSETIAKVSMYGKILIIGTDVSKISKFVEKFASKVSAIVVSPDHDLHYNEKRKKTKEYLKKYNLKLKDKHQMDALSAALIAYRHFNTLFNKINNEISDKSLLDEVKKEILINNIPIKKALKMVTS